MRLIDADILIEKLKSYAECDWNKSLCTMLPNVVDDCIEFVEEQTTAYDIDKVVNELEEAKHEICLSDDDLEHYQNGIDNAIEIVKQGGADDDVCEWNQTSTARYKTGCGYKLEEYFDTYACYCKQCGKKIKVVER